MTYWTNAAHTLSAQDNPMHVMHLLYVIYLDKYYRIYIFYISQIRFQTRSSRVKYIKQTNVIKLVCTYMERAIEVLSLSIPVHIWFEPTTLPTLLADNTK